jgi:hypothetical protein
VRRISRWFRETRLLMTSVVHVDPGVELSPETNNVQPKPSSPVFVVAHQ